VGAKPLRNPLLVGAPSVSSAHNLSLERQLGG
jgi:hypothetical protein